MVLLKMVVPDIYRDDAHVVALFNIVVPDINNDVFIDIPPVFKRIASHVPELVFKIMLSVDGEAMVKFPTRL
jgi:hypothetical protein